MSSNMSRLEVITDSVRNARQLKEILVQMRELGFDKLESVDQNFRRFNLKFYDGLEEKTYLLEVDASDFPEKEMRFASKQLPPNSRENFFAWIPGKSSLTQLYSEFVDQITFFAPVRKILKDLDENSWVLDPPAPIVGLQHLFRRVVVARGVSLQITLDPSDATSLPDLKFLGPEEKVRPLKENFKKNLHNFDPDYTMVQNLENILDLTLPLPDPSDQMGGDEYNVDCGICYSFRLGDSVPTRSCNQNPKCGRLFHEECLCEWLRSVPDCRQSFQTIFGKCPYCDMQISCKISK